MTRATKKRLLIWLFIAIVLATSLALLFRPKPVAVDLAAVTKGTLVVTVNETGETQVRDTFVLSAPVTGRMNRIEVESGDSVVANETVLATIDPIDPGLLDIRSRAQAQAAVGAAEAAERLAAANVAQAQADVEFNQAELDRARKLRAQQMIPVRELDIANHDYKAAKAALETSLAALTVSQHELERTRAQLLMPSDGQSSTTEETYISVQAPVDGSVLRILRESEGIVVAGEPLIEIGDTADLEIVADLLSTDAVKVNPGQRVIIEDWGGSGNLEGIVRRVEPYARTKVSALGIEEKRANVIIDLVNGKEQRPGLGHGYQLEVRIVLWEGSNVLTVPLTALVRDGDRWALYVEQEGRAEHRTVELGRKTDFEAEVVDGLEEGERLIRYPTDKVVDSVRIVERKLY